MIKIYKFIGKKDKAYTIDMKLNYNCPEDQKNGEGPGSCKGASKSDTETKVAVSNLRQEKNISEGKHPAEPSDSWKKSAEKLESGVYKKGNTYRLGENSATVEKGENMAFAVSTNGEAKREFSTRGQAEFAAETYAKTGKYPEKAPIKSKLPDKPKTIMKKGAEMELVDEAGNKFYRRTKKDSLQV